MKGIILAGGSGSRLYPLTLSLSKHLIPVYDKPMIYYPLSILMLAGIKDILIITTHEDLSSYKRLLGNGNKYGINISYEVQKSPDGLAQAFIIGEDFINKDNVCLILGDNIFWGQGLTPKLLSATQNTEGATIFGYEVKDPERFGVVSFDNDMKVKSIDEKPANPKSNFAVTGLYFYNNDVINIAKSISPSSRGELEITDINKIYLSEDLLKIEILGRGFAWLDTGTFDSLLNASSFVETIEKRQGYKIACLEEIAFNNNWLTKENIRESAAPFSKNSYGNYLLNLIKE